MHRERVRRVVSLRRCRIPFHREDTGLQSQWIPLRHMLVDWDAEVGVGGESA